MRQFQSRNSNWWIAACVAIFTSLASTTSYGQSELVTWQDNPPGPSIKAGWVPKTDANGNPVYDTIRVAVYPDVPWFPDNLAELEITVNSSGNQQLAFLPIGHHGMYDIPVGQTNGNVHLSCEYKGSWESLGTTQLTSASTPPNNNTDPPGPVLFPPAEVPQGCQTGDCQKKHPHAENSSSGAPGICPSFRILAGNWQSDFEFGGKPKSSSNCVSCTANTINENQSHLLNVGHSIAPNKSSQFSSLGPGVFSSHDISLRLFPNPGSADSIVLTDPVTGRTILAEDASFDGNYQFNQDLKLFSDFSLLENGQPLASNSGVSNANVSQLSLTAKRRNGWIYQFSFFDSGHGYLHGRLAQLTSPSGRVITYTFHNATPSNPMLQGLCKTASDEFGNSLVFTKKATQVAGRNVHESVQIKSNSTVNATISYEYSNSSNLLETIKKDGVTKTSITAGNYSTWQSTTLEITELVAGLLITEKVELSQDYQIYHQSLINQYANVLLGKREANGTESLVIYPSQTDANQVTILDNGKLYEYKTGQSLRYYSDFTISGNSITGTKELSYSQSSFSSTNSYFLGLPSSHTDETGYTVQYQYDAHHNVSLITHPDSSFEKFTYDIKGNLLYYRNRAGQVTTNTYQNGVLVRTNKGMVDLIGSGQATATPESIMILYGYYPAGDPHANMLKWKSTVVYSQTVTEPNVLHRENFSYNSNGLLSRVDFPKPEGQVTAPFETFTYSNGLLTGSINKLGQTTQFFYDSLGQNIQTLYSDGSTDQTWFNGLDVYKKNRNGNVSLIRFDSEGRPAKRYTSYGTDDNLADQTIDIVHDSSNNGFSETTYNKLIQIHYTEDSISGEVSDFRGRPETILKYGASNGNFPEITSFQYENNRLFCESEKFTDFDAGGQYEKRTYYGHSADGFTVRTIQTRDPSITFSDNSSVMNAVRPTGQNPAFIITDAVRDVVGNTVQQFNGMNTEARTVYNSLSQAVQKTNGFGLSYALTESFEFTPLGQVSRHTNPAGIVTAYTFDHAGNVLSKTNAFGTSKAATTSFSYTADNKVATVTLPNGGISYRFYNSCCGRFEGSKDPLGNGKINNVDSTGRVVHTAVVEDYDSHTNIHDPIDSKTVNEKTNRYDQFDRLVASTRWKTPLGTVDVSNPPIAGLNGIPVTDGITTRVFYDDVVADSHGICTANGESVNLLGGGTGTISIKLAVDKASSSVSNGGASAYSFSLTAGGSAKATVSADEKTMNVEILDRRGQVILSALMTGPAHTTPNQLVTWTSWVRKRTYNHPDGYLCEATWQVNRDGNKTIQAINAFGLTVASVDELGNTALSKFDPAGNLVESQDRLNRTTKFEFDLLNRNTKSIDPLQGETLSGYSATTGQLISKTDAKNNQISIDYDAAGRPNKLTDRVNGVVLKNFNNMDKVESIQDQQGAITVYEYDLAGRKTGIIFPDHIAGSSKGHTGYGKKTQEFDAAGRVVYSEDQRGYSITNTYDMVDRLKTKDRRIGFHSPNGTIESTDSFEYNQLGKLVSATSGESQIVVNFTYNELGLLNSESRTIDSHTYTVDVEHDNYGRRQSVSFSNGSEYQHTYDPRGYLDETTFDNVLMDKRVYDAEGQLTQSGNIVKNNYTYFDDGKIESISHVHPVGTPTTKQFGAYNFQYDVNGNKTSETISGAYSGYGFSTPPTLGYDAEDRLLAANRNDGNLNQSWNLSLTGDWNSHTSNGVTTNRTHNVSHEINSIGSSNFSHDVKGNITKVPAAARKSSYDLILQWSHENQLIRAWEDRSYKTDVISFEYDALGNRARKVVKSYDDIEYGKPPYTGELKSTSTTDYVILDKRVVADGKIGNLKQIYIHGAYIDEIIAKKDISKSEIVNYHYKTQNSVSGLSNQAGEKIEGIVYDPFGKATFLDPSGATRLSSAFANEYTFTGRRLDRKTELLYFRSRYYSPTIGRFISRDQLGFVDGMNLYSAYFAQTGVDPSGNSCTTVSKNMRIDMKPRLRTQGVIPFAGIPIPYYISAGWKINYGMKYRQCTKCCPNGNTVVDESVEGYLTAFARIEAILGLRINHDWGNSKLKGYLGIKGELGIEFGGSLGGSTDRCNGKNDFAFTACFSVKGKGKLSGGGSVRYQVDYYSYDIAALEVYGQVTSGGKVCLRVDRGGVSVSSFEVDAVKFSGGARACLLGGCVEYEF